MSEVDRLRAEVQLLRSEIAALKQQLHDKAGRAQINLLAANSARTQASAHLDQVVLLQTVKLVAFRPTATINREYLEMIGFPFFVADKRLPHRAAEHLNLIGVAAPRGGLWNARQVKRAWFRHAQKIGLRVS